VSVRTQLKKNGTDFIKVYLFASSSCPRAWALKVVKKATLFQEEIKITCVVLVGAGVAET
jgi:hypothetical protein